MTRMTQHLSSLVASICSALLAMIGFNSCSNGDEPCMYGMPIGDFEIKGSVTTEDGASVDDAEIRVTLSYESSGLFSLHTTSTNADGRYVAKGESYGEAELKVVCLPSNPDLEPDSVIVKMHYNKENATGTWDVGDAKETVDFKLKPKTPAQE